MPLTGRRATVEDCPHRLDVAALVRGARLEQSGLWSIWTATGRATLFPPVVLGEVTVGLLLTGSRGRLWLTWSDDDGPGDQEVTLSPTGYWRWLARCPLTGRRVAKLYRPPGAGLFGSREGHGLRYAVSTESRAEQAARRALRLRRALGEVAPLLGGPLPLPPPKMLARAYLAACDAIRAAEGEARPRAERHTLTTPGPHRGGRDRLH